MNPHTQETAAGRSWRNDKKLSREARKRRYHAWKGVGMKRAVFLDRDGTINREVDNLRDLDQLRLLPGVARAIAHLNKMGYLVIVITNQPVVARGLITEEELDEIHAVIIRRLGSKNAKIDGIYYCPHHPNANVRKYRMNCKCRKPNTGLVRQAIKRFNINPSRSFMIGDTMPDIVMGKRARLTTMLIRTAKAPNDRGYRVEPDFAPKNLEEAAEIIANIDRRRK